MCLHVLHIVPKDGGNLFMGNIPKCTGTWLYFPVYNWSSYCLFSHCLCVRYSGYWITMRQLKEWVFHGRHSTATTCCTARNRNWSLSTLPHLGNSLDLCSWAYAHVAWARGKKNLSDIPEWCNKLNRCLFTRTGMHSSNTQSRTINGDLFIASHIRSRICKSLWRFAKHLQM